MARTAALPALKAESGLSHYLDEIRRFPMLEPQEEYMLARSWREHGDRDAVHKLVTSHLRLVAKIAMGYRGYGLPISEVVSEGNVGLMQAVKRFEPEKGFRLATYAMWWIKAAIQEYILRSWSLVKMGTTANQKKLFFNLRKAKSKISALEEGDLRPDQVQVIAKRLGVTEQDVVDMNRRLAVTPRSTRRSATTARAASGRTGWSMTRQARNASLQRARKAITGTRRLSRRSTSSMNASGGFSRHDDWPTIRSRSKSSLPSSTSRASVCARSRCAPSRKCRRR